MKSIIKITPEIIKVKILLSMKFDLRKKQKKFSTAIDDENLVSKVQHVRTV